MALTFSLSRPFERLDSRPIDESLVFSTFADLTAYALSNPVAYKGQILAVSGTNTPYIISDQLSALPIALQSYVQSYAGGAFLPLSGGLVTGNIISNSAISANEIDIDNIQIEGNTISSTNSDGDIILQPNGAGDVSISADTLKIGDTSPAFLTTNGATSLTINTNNGSNSGLIRITHGINGVIDLVPNGSGEVNISKVDIDAGTIDNVTIGDTTAAISVSTALLNVDNIRVDGNVISSTNTGGNISLQPNSNTTTATGNLSASGTVTGNIVNATTGFRVNNNATSSQFLRGNGTNIVLSAIQVSDVPTLNQNTTGSAATLTTTRTLWGQNFNGSQNVSGNLTNVGDISGTAGITIQTGGAGSNISLITTGTGDIQLTPGSSGGTVNIPNIDLDGGTINGTTIGLTVPASAVFTGVTVAGNVSIGGNLFVSGSATQVNTTDLVVRDPIIFLAEGNLNDTVDIGFTAAYNHGLTPPRHTGLVRDNTSKKWTLFSGLTSEILSAVQIPFDNPSLVIDTLVANVEGDVEGTLTGNVSGTALKANQFTTGRIISATGDISYSSGSFDGSANVTGTATINNNAVTTTKILDDNVTYAKIQNVTAGDRVLGRVSGAGNIEEIVCTASGRALLSAANVATQRNNLGLGSTQSVTFGDVIVDNQTQTVLNKVYTGIANLSDTLNLLTFPDASYKTAKFTVQIKRPSDTSRCALEILVTKNNATWTGTVYGIVDPAGLFADVDVSVNGGSVELAFVFGADNTTYNVTAFAQAISD